MTKDRRDLLIEYVEKEFIGPDPIDWEGLRQENGEEILVSDPPMTRYIAGILFPKHSKEEDKNDEVLFEEDYGDEEESDQDDFAPKNQTSGSPYEYLNEAEELIDRSNAFNQSALSLTVAINNNDNVKVFVSAGKYNKKTEKVENKEKSVTKYLRRQIEWECDKELLLPKAGEGLCTIPVLDKSSGKETGLKVDIICRYRKENYSIYTFTLENSKETSGPISDEDCFFQVKMKIISSEGFKFLPDSIKLNKDEDYLSNTLLYRNVKNYAIGHGCAASWDTDENDKVYSIKTSIFPSYEVKPILPSVIEGVSLSMMEMSNVDDFPKVYLQLKLLCEKYNLWIKELEKKKKTLDSSLQETAQRHIDNCYICLNRMEEGVELLNNDNTVKKAFQWMNKAMLLQQLHYGLPLQKWVDDGNEDIKLERQFDELPVYENQKTWFNYERKKYGIWRPFQIAFILMNLESLRNKYGNGREIVDLIWFPTGGGKTEAYLGLSAYTIFLRRLLNKADSGTAILMRYTLRLLTAQQYERAAAMICACEVIRRENLRELGNEEINIGLWVGIDTTPNNVKDAVNKYTDLYSGKSSSNPFVMLKCPWCGAQMGLVEVGKKHTRRLPGYATVQGPHKSKKFVFRCRNTEQFCDFSSANSNLPLYVIDEDIYEKCPTLIVGTVDKFAMLPFRPEAQKIFGFENGEKVTSPELIIQDELHLISGPLGSMVGHYETMINDLCKMQKDGKTFYPKIIASTATISRAKEQCHALYGTPTEKVFQFPPSGLDAGDSFFAYEEKNKNGRKYVGILASGSPSDSTTSIRLFAALLYAAKTMEVEVEKDRDPYWTNIGYFNSIRELGQSQTWIKADISQQLDVLYKRRYDDRKYEHEEYKKYRRYIWRDEELTSRISGDKVTASLANLNISYPPEEDEDGKVKEYPIDICLATNMISVGLDVQRLGLMTVEGQPKTTSEYIQATSRVGRDLNNAPGIVFVVYRPSKPRDKSYYEHFNYYHSRLYCNVEPTSVTPFSAPVRERALHAIMFGLMRLEHDEIFNEDPPKYPRQEIINDVKHIISKRVNDIDYRELDDTLKLFDYNMQNWEDWNPQKWTPQYNFDQSLGDAVPLMYGSGSKPNANWDGRGMKTPTSMRNVDSSCEAKVLLNKYIEREE